MNHIENNNSKIAKYIVLASVTLFSFMLNFHNVEAAGTFSISPASGNYIRSCNQSVDIVVDVTSGQSNAADVIITYDTTKIEIIDALPSVPGIQILPGNAFESYAGNTVNTGTGEIKLVGYSSSGMLQNSATFASIHFKSKPLATNGGFNFTFSGANPYNTLDSNIADSLTSFDMLSGISNASYTFSSGSCASDTTPPIITFVSPTNLSNNVAPATPVTLKLEDNGAGVALSSLQVVINGVIYTATSPEVSISGSPSNYSVTIVPNTPFITNAVSVISVTVSDTAGNSSNGNISINAKFSCPVTVVTKTGNCTIISASPTATPKPDRESPVVTITSTTSIDVRKVFPLKITVQDNKGISPESFVLTIGGKTYTPAANPDRLHMTGSKTSYSYSIDLIPEELAVTDEGKIIGSVKISDLEGNTRIEQLIFTITGKPIGNTTTKNVKTWQDTIATTIVYYIAPIIAAVFVGFLGILSTQPVIAQVVDHNKKKVRFPRGYYIYANGVRQKLFGNFNGKLHGRIPREAVQLVIQKYGFVTVTQSIHPTVKHELKVVSLNNV